MAKFLALYDIHWGYEYDKSRNKRPIHDVKAVKTALKFAKDFKPDIVILGGDILDCGPVSHHNKHKPGNVEGLRLLKDMEECRKHVIEPLEALGASKYHYIIGNHEDWLNDVYIDQPALEGLLSLKRDMLSDKWAVTPQGQSLKVGELTFLHGDTLKGSAEHVAKLGWNLYNRNIRFGHFHTFQAHTPKQALDSKKIYTSICVPCLCRKDPTYSEGKPNAWIQGFNYGYIWPNGNFNDYVAIVVDYKTIINGKVYEGK